MAVSAPRAGIFLLGAPFWSDPAIDNGGSIVAVNTKTGFPVSNLLLQRPTDRYVDDDVTTMSTITIDAGGAKSFNIVSMLASNISDQGGWRIRYADTEGELTSGPANDTAPFGPCLHFDGSQTALAVISAPMDFTVGMWVRLQDDTSNRAIFAISGLSEVPMLSTNASSKFAFQDNSNLGDGLCTSTTTVVANTWYHVAVTYDDTTGDTQLIVNGILEDSNTALSGGAWTPGTGFILAVNLSPNDQMIGEINQVRLWDKVRSAAEVLADYATVLSPPVSNLVDYWPLEEGTGDTSVSTGSDATTLSGVEPLTWCFPEKFWSTSDYPKFSSGMPSYIKPASLFTRNPLGATARWMRIDILDPLNTDGELRYGRLMVSAAPQFRHNIQYGSASGVEDTSRISVATSGLERVTPGVRRRTYDLNMRMFVDADSSRLIELIETRGVLYDVIFVQDPTETTRAKQYLMQARFATPNGKVRHTGFSVRDSRLAVREMV